MTECPSEKTSLSRTTHTMQAISIIHRLMQLQIQPSVGNAFIALARNTHPWCLACRILAQINVFNDEISNIQINWTIRTKRKKKLLRFSAFHAMPFPDSSITNAFNSKWFDSLTVVGHHRKLSRLFQWAIVYGLYNNFYTKLLSDDNWINVDQFLKCDAPESISQRRPVYRNVSCWISCKSWSIFPFILTHRR